MCATSKKLVPATKFAKGKRSDFTINKLMSDVPGPGAHSVTPEVQKDQKGIPKLMGKDKPIER